jgi:hypothetical protein
MCNSFREFHPYVRNCIHPDSIFNFFPCEDFVVTGRDTLRGELTSRVRSGGLVSSPRWRNGASGTSHSDIDHRLLPSISTSMDLAPFLARTTHLFFGGLLICRLA